MTSEDNDEQLAEIIPLDLASNAIQELQSYDELQRAAFMLGAFGVESDTPRAERGSGRPLRSAVRARSSCDKPKLFMMTAGCNFASELA